MIVYRTKYYGIHTDRVRELAMKRGKKVGDAYMRELADAALGRRSRESLRSLEIADSDYLKRLTSGKELSQREQDYLLNKLDIINYIRKDMKAKGLKKPDYTTTNPWRDGNLGTNIGDESNAEKEIKKAGGEILKNTADKIDKDIKKNALLYILKSRRNPVNYLRDKKITKEMMDAYEKEGLDIHKNTLLDEIKEGIEIARNPFSQRKPSVGSTHFRLFPDGKTEIHIARGDHSRPDRLGHEASHVKELHEDQGIGGRIVINKVNKGLITTNKRDKEAIAELLGNPDDIHSVIRTIQNEVNTADRGKVMEPFLKSKSVTEKDLERYSKNKTDYQRLIQGYVPPSLDYHADPATIKKIKEHIEEQQAIENYLNTDRKWL